MLEPNRPFFPVEEYLWEEQRADFKNEYFDGKIYAMAGESPEHSQIQVNLILELGTAFRGENCRVLTSDLEVGIEEKPGTQVGGGGKRGYPDASVVCGPVELFKGDRYTIANPLILFEVLSPSTRNYASNFKLEHYQRISSLKAYVMVDSERIWVRNCQRLGDHNRWVLEELRKL